MFRTGLLILTNPVTHLLTSVPRILASAADHVQEVLYIHLAPGLGKDKDLLSMQVPYIPCTSAVKKLVTCFYSRATSHHQMLDLRVIVGNVGDRPPRPRPSIETYSLHDPYQIVLTNLENDTILGYAKKYFKPASSKIDMKVIQVERGDEVDAEELQLFDNICLGGTFDRLHTGHKILLNDALVICKKRLVVGVTDGAMNNKKLLPEMMETCDARISAVQEFVEDVKPQLIYSIVPILDPFGPSITEPDLQCIVVSEETAKGGQAVNTKRAEKGMSSLSMVIIPLVQDEHHLEGEEEKISSSSQRRRLLGTLIRPPKIKPDMTRSPYILGFTGGIASGKSSVCQRLKGLGAAVVDCDKLGHKAYEKDGAAYPKMIETFGEDILADDGTINRGALGPRVFGSPELLQKLNDIVWPVIRNLAMKQTQEFHEKGYAVVVLDAAVLLEAGWDDVVHEIWTTVVPKDEAVKRIMERNKLDEESALKRISAQMSNQDRVDKANVVLCTMWEYCVTQKQVEKAWHLLQERIPAQTSQL